ncbi:MAG: glutaredoxin [Candidatus Poseidoniales archaeon]
MIEIYGTPMCPFCEKAKSLCEIKGLDFSYKLLGTDYTHEEFMEKFPTARTFPQIKMNGKAVGGYDSFEKLV